MTNIINRGLALAAALGLGTMSIMLAAPAAQAGDGDQTCTTETTGWVLEAPDGRDWVQIDQRTVTDEEAYNETVSEATEAQHYSLKGNSGIGKDEVPVFPADYWQANTTQEPHYAGNGLPASNVNGSDYVEGDEGLHYASAGTSGLRDWFYFQAAHDAVIVHHDAVTHEEYVFQLTTCDANPPGDTEVTAAVRFVDPTCASAEAVVQTLDGDGVRYDVSGMASAGSTVDVTATAKEGYVLVGKSTWTHTFATPVGCDEGGGGEGNPPGDHHGNNPGNDPGDNQGANPSTNLVESGSQPQRAELPHTGAADQMGLGAGALGLLALGSLLLRVSRRPEGVTALG